MQRLPQIAILSVQTRPKAAAYSLQQRLTWPFINASSLVKKRECQSFCVFLYFSDSLMQNFSSIILNRYK